MPIRSDVFTLFSTNVISAADQASASFAVGSYEEAVILLRVTAKAGTTPAIAFDVETSDDDTNWHKLEDIATITDPDVTSTYLHPAHQATNFGKFIRVNNPAAPTGASSPSLTLTGILMVKGR